MLLLKASTFSARFPPLSLKPLPILRLNTDFKVFAVASNIGAAGYVHGYDLIMHKHWASNEAMKRPTWREVKAIIYDKEIALGHNLGDIAYCWGKRNNFTTSFS
jgi:hypothetical protein